MSASWLPKLPYANCNKRGSCIHIEMGRVSQLLIHDLLQRKPRQWVLLSVTPLFAFSQLIDQWIESGTKPVVPKATYFDICFGSCVCQCDGRYMTHGCGWGVGGSLRFATTKIRHSRRSTKRYCRDAWEGCFDKLAHVLSSMRMNDLPLMAWRMYSGT